MTSIYNSGFYFVMVMVISKDLPRIAALLRISIINITEAKFVMVLVVQLQSGVSASISPLFQIYVNQKILWYWWCDQYWLWAVLTYDLSPISSVHSLPSTVGVVDTGMRQNKCLDQHNFEFRSVSTCRRYSYEHHNMSNHARRRSLH